MNGFRERQNRRRGRGLGYGTGVSARHGWLLLALATLGLPACAALIKSPEVSVEMVEVQRVTLTGGSVILGLHLSNPNNFELKGTAIDYTLRVARAGEANPDWRSLASGVQDKAFSLPALGSTTLEVPLQFDWVGVGTVVKELLERGRVDYQAEGAVRVEMPHGLVRVPFRRTGKVTM